MTFRFLSIDLHVAEMKFDMLAVYLKQNGVLVTLCHAFREIIGEVESRAADYTQEVLRRLFLDELQKKMIQKSDQYFLFSIVILFCLIGKIEIFEVLVFRIAKLDGKSCVVFVWC